MSRVRVMAASLAVFLLCLLGGAGPALAQSDGVRVELRVEAREVYVGQPFYARLIVDGAPDADLPDFPEVDGLRSRAGAQNAQRSSSVVMTPGGVERRELVRAIRTYEIVATRPGVFLIPPLALEVDGREYRSRSAQVRAVDPPTSGAVEVTLEVDDETPFAGQAVDLRVTLEYDADRTISELRFTFGPGIDALTVLPPDDADRRDRRPRVEFLGAQTPAVVREVRRDGRRLTRVSFERRVVPTEAGAFAIGPVFVSLDMSRRGPGRFPRADWRPEFASSDPLTLRVGALPREGRPDGFSGLVGRFEVATRADRTEVDVGDPIELEIVVRGSAALARIPTPDLEGAGAFADAFQVSDAPEPRRRGDGFVVFRKIVRPLRDDIDAIPSVELPYFDTDSGRYGLARSRPIPLRVNRTRRVTLTDAVGAEGAAAGATLGDGAAGLAHNYGVEDGGLVGAPRGAGDVLASPVWIGALAAPPAAYALALCGVLVRRRSASGEAARRRRSALPRARAALARAGDTSEIAEAVFAYAREATGRDAPGMTPGDAEEAIAALSGAEAAAGVRAALDRCDAGRYAGAASSEAGRLRDEALEAIERADRASRGKGVA